MTTPSWHDSVDPSRSINTSGTTEIDRSWPKSIALLILVVCFAAYALCFALNVFSNSPSFFTRLVSFLGGVACCAIVSMVFWRTLTLRGHLVTLSPEGIRDLRIAPDFIPWPAIARVDVISSRVRYLELKFYAGLLPPKLERIMVRTGLLSTPRALQLNAHELSITFDRLHTLVSSYHRDHGPNA